MPSSSMTAVCVYRLTAFRPRSAWSASSIWQMTGILSPVLWPESRRKKLQGYVKLYFHTPLSDLYL